MVSNDAFDGEKWGAGECEMIGNFEIHTLFPGPAGAAPLAELSPAMVI
jgi:hypothetical protein